MDKIKIADIVVILLLIIGIILSVWKIFGHSPTSEIIFGVAIGAIVANQFRFEQRLSRLEVKVDYIARDLKTLMHDFNEFKRGRK